MEFPDKEAKLSNIKDNALVTKSNKIIEARLKKKLSTAEIKIIMVLISMISPDDHDFKSYTFRTKDLAEVIGLKCTNKYSLLNSITEELRGKTMLIKEDNGTLLQIGWLSSALYHKNKGMVELSFDPKLRPYLLELKGNFTSYLLKNILKLRNEYSPRLYGLLKQYEGIGKRKLTIKNLRSILGIEDDRYKLYGDFKRHVLKMSQKDIKKNTDISFDFKEIKEGRKVVELVFKISSKPVEKKNEYLIELNKDEKVVKVDNISTKEKILKQLKELGVMKKVIKSIFNDHKLEVIQQALDNSYAQAELMDNLRNHAGLFVDMLPEPGEECLPSKAFLDKQKKEKESNLIEKQIAETRKREELKDIQTKLEREYTRFIDEKFEKTINKLSKEKLETFEQEYLDVANNFEVTQFKKGLRRSFNIFMGKKLLDPDVLDFGKFAKDKGYNVKKNKDGKFELSEI